MSFLAGSISDAGVGSAASLFGSEVLCVGLYGFCRSLASAGDGWTRVYLDSMALWARCRALNQGHDFASARDLNSMQFFGTHRSFFARRLKHPVGQIALAI